MSFKYLVKSFSQPCALSWINLVRYIRSIFVFFSAPEIWIFFNRNGSTYDWFFHSGRFEFVSPKFRICFGCTWVLCLCEKSVHLSLFLIFILVDSSSPCPIYLTISPISHSAESSHLEINWGPKCSNPAEWIAVYGEDPTVSYAAPLFTANTDDKPTGHIKTSVKLHKIHLPYGWNKHDVMNGLKPDHIKSACLPFFIASFNGRALQTLDCLKVQPNWMKEMPQIRNIALKNLFIPGTHCSGCYDRRTKTSHSILLKRFGYAQSFDVWTQLVFGVRYLDISVGFVLLLNRVNQEEHGELFNHFTDTKIITTRLMNHQICGLSMRIYLLHRCCQFYKRYDCLQCYPKKWLF